LRLAGERHAAALVKFLQAEPSKNQGKKPWFSLDLLGFIRRNPGFSMGYGDSKRKNSVGLK
jgi:hypothetical protein